MMSLNSCLSLVTIPNSLCDIIDRYTFSIAQGTLLWAIEHESLQFGCDSKVKNDVVIRYGIKDHVIHIFKNRDKTPTKSIQLINVSVAARRSVHVGNSVFIIFSNEDDVNDQRFVTVFDLNGDFKYSFEVHFYFHKFRQNFGIAMGPNDEIIFFGPSRHWYEKEWQTTNVFIYSIDGSLKKTWTFKLDFCEWQSFFNSGFTDDFGNLYFTDSTSIILKFNLFGHLTQRILFHEYIDIDRVMSDDKTRISEISVRGDIVAFRTMCGDIIHFNMKTQKSIHKFKIHEKYAKFVDHYLYICANGNIVVTSDNGDWRFG